MKVTAITLDDNGLPNTATVVLTRAEMQLIGRLIGKHSPDSAEDLLPGHGPALDELWNGLTGGVFNRYWDNGIEGAIRGERG